MSLDIETSIKKFMKEDLFLNLLRADVSLYNL